ncbi:uncharacterized protein VTP21DRAFT_6340 [Calcarisporiella thermophila]|uniref:uncharacterized protein n=1 Tax=Calcarisporiella thermophila TaxID=911321 RepID=UPI003741ECC5
MHSQKLDTPNRGFTAESPSGFSQQESQYFRLLLTFIGGDGQPIHSPGYEKVNSGIIAPSNSHCSGSTSTQSNPHSMTATPISNTTSSTPSSVATPPPPPATSPSLLSINVQRESSETTAEDSTKEWATRLLHEKLSSSTSEITLQPPPSLPIPLMELPPTPSIIGEPRRARIRSLSMNIFRNQLPISLKSPKLPLSEPPRHSRAPSIASSTKSSATGRGLLRWFKNMSSIDLAHHRATDSEESGDERTRGAFVERELKPPNAPFMVEARQFHEEPACFQLSDHVSEAPGRDASAGVLTSSPPTPSDPHQKRGIHRSCSSVDVVQSGSLDWSSAREVGRYVSLNNGRITQEEFSRRRAAVDAVVAGRIGEEIRNENMRNNRERSFSSPLPSLATIPDHIKCMQIRKFIAQEIVTTEESFLSHLLSIRTVFMEPLFQSIDTDNPLVSSRDLNTLFAHLEDIITTSTQFATQLRQLRSTWSDQSCIGAYFLRVDFDAYIRYALHHPEAQRVLKRVNKRLVYRRFMQQSRQEANRLELGDLLIMPVQRITRYCLLLRDLKKHTPLDHPDFADVEQALMEVSAVAMAANNVEPLSNSSSGNSKRRTLFL